MMADETMRRPARPFVVSGPRADHCVALMEALTKELTSRGVRVGVLCHGASCSAGALKRAGAASVMVSGGSRTVHFGGRGGAPITPAYVAGRFFPDTDAVLVYGMRGAGEPEVRVAPESPSHSAVASLLAVVGAPSRSERGVHRFRRGEIGRLADLVTSRIGGGERG